MHFVSFRIYAPGESVGYTFNQLPEVHNFPSAELENAVMRTQVAFLPRQQNFNVILCRSQSPILQSHVRGRKCGSEERYMKKSYHLVDKSGEPTPSTSKCEDYLENVKIVSKSEKQTTKLKNYEKITQKQLVEKPPIGQKLIDRKNDSNMKEKLVPCPLSNTLKRKVDQLSPTMKYTHEFPGTVSSSMENESSLCSGFVNSTAGNMPENYPNIPSTSHSKHSDHSRDLCDFKTPNKVVGSKAYTKPSSLTVSTNNSYMGSKRLPSPKVIVTGHKKPEPSYYKKRCLDLDLKYEHEITSGELHDLTKPLSPSDLEAYLSSLSSKAPMKLGATKLDEIPTTKCSFFLGDEVPGELGESSQKGAKVRENDSDIPYCANAQCLSYVDGICDTSLEQKKKELPHVRNLFSDKTSKSDLDSKRTADVTSREKSPDQNTIQESAKCCFSKESENSNHHIQKSLSREETPVKSGEVIPKTSVADAVQRERIIDQNVCIPCSVETGSSAVSNLVQNLECMEIDEASKNQNSVSVLDREVEQHFDNPTGVSSSEKGNLLRGASKTLQESCDTSPSRNLSLCKQLLQKEFQQNVKNVSKYYFSLEQNKILTYQFGK